MKFRDPKTGEVFEDIKGAWQKYCDHHTCHYRCAINTVVPGNRAEVCMAWCQAHPAEAALLMGYAVVEDNAIDGMCCDCAEGGPCCDYSENEDCPSRKEDGSCWRPYTEKEDPMEQTYKPRICQVLGVEVGEPFEIEGFKGEYHINDDGVLKWGGQTSDDAIYEAINHPDRIIRKPRFTREEVEDARALVRLLGATGIERSEYGGNLCAAIGEVAKVVINQDLLPSLRPGQSIALEELAGGGEGLWTCCQAVSSRPCRRPWTATGRSSWTAAT